MKKPVLFFSLVCMFVSCNLIPFPFTKDVTYTFTEDKKPEIRRNDTIYYRNISNNLKDTFLITAHFYAKTNDNVTYDEAEYVYTLLNKNRKYTDVFFYFSCHSENESVQFWKRFQEMEGIYEKNRTITHFVLNSKTYSSVVYFSNSGQINTDILPCTIYFSYKYGILSYEYLDGSVYELMND